jgi:hypothetical protein
MRDFLDSILEFIGSELLTDQEYAETQPLETNEGTYSLEIYLALKDVIVGREALSTQADKLKAFFQAKGVLVSGPAKPAASSILIGSVL